MKFKYLFAIFLSLTFFGASVSAQNKKLGGLKGKVRSTKGESIGGVLIEVRTDTETVKTVKTDTDGEFLINGLEEGVYKLYLDKEGWTNGVLGGIEVKAGKIRNLGGRLVLGVDQGTLALMRGSVFDENGRSLPNVKIQVFRVGEDNKKIDETVSNNLGEFGFRYRADRANYRFVAESDGFERASKEILVNGAQVYRFSLILKPKK